MKQKLGWLVLSLIVAVVSVWAVAAQGKSFSVSSFIEYIKKSNPLCIVAAVIAMLGFIGFEAIAIRSICRAFGYKSRRSRSFVYSATDIYFSAITPSASGGQPACAFFMVRDGISFGVVTAALFLNLAMYALAIVVLGLLCIIIRPGVFMQFGAFSRTLIVIGYIVQIGLASFFVIVLKSEKMLHKIFSLCINVLVKLHFLKNAEKRRIQLQESMQKYKECVDMLSGKRNLLVKVFICNLLQRMSQIMVTIFVYMGVYGSVSKVIDIFAIQEYAVLGSNCVPIPGAMGIFDYLMLDGLGSIIPGGGAVSLELFSRSLSFYCCIIICGLTVLINYPLTKRRIQK